MPQEGIYVHKAWTLKRKPPQAATMDGSPNKPQIASMVTRTDVIYPESTEKQWSEEHTSNDGKEVSNIHRHGCQHAGNQPQRHMVSLGLF